MATLRIHCGCQATHPSGVRCAIALGKRDLRSVLGGAIAQCKAIPQRREVALNVALRNWGSRPSDLCEADCPSNPVATPEGCEPPGEHSEDTLKRGFDASKKTRFQYCEASPRGNASKGWWPGIVPIETRCFDGEISGELRSKQPFIAAGTLQRFFFVRACTC